MNDLNKEAVENQKFSSYSVKVTSNVLNRRSGPSKSQAIIGLITDKGIYKIVEEQDGWGKLESDLGWILLRYTEKIKNEPLKEEKKEQYKTHTVKENDTLWRISAQYLGSGSKYREIMELNNLLTDNITVGQILKIPN